MSEGRSYPEDYRTTTRHRREYPAPGDWALNVVEGDGVSWYRFEGIDADHVADAPDLEPDDTAYLGLYRDTDGTDYHQFSVNGEVVARLRDGIDEDRFWQAVAECLWWAVDEDAGADPLVYADAQDVRFRTVDEVEERRLEETAAAHQTLDAFGEEP